MLSAVLFALGAGLATALGAVPYAFTRALPRRPYDFVLGTGAGLMLAAALVALVPRALADGGALPTVAGLAAGALLLAVLERLIPHHHAAGHHEHGHGHDDEEHEVRRGLLIGGALVIHRLPEGFAIGAGFAAGDGHGLGTLVALAVALQNVCEGLVMAAPLKRGGLGTPATAALLAASGLALPAAALAGWLLGALAAAALPALLAVGAGALLFVVFAEVLTETHGHGNEVPATLGVFLGVMTTILMQAWVHAH